MIGLLLKDLITLKDQGKMIIVLLVFYSFIAVGSGNNLMFGMMIAILCAMLPITVMGFDEKAKWDKYALSMPISRFEVVMSKYLLGICFFILGFVVNVIFNLFTTSQGLMDIVEMSLGVVGIGVIYLCFVLPLLFKFGVEKGRFFLMLVMFIPLGIGILLNKLGFVMPPKETIDTMMAFIPLLSIIIFFCSIGLSYSIYSKKEL
ncbi:ABC-2 family transporter [Natranaerovirga pectinivora]|uniref:ABC-2 family transporter n=1 Tax=Natranaerovirga pectinivora TaxID=682400 RepID=A0A4R3MP08_9FIRM|nr:ABC-2 transporter permease [Natranaerovirga pectinivora]TCT16252.1 ABC-2 family transporter [Natranaerovirga pectinivora]